MMNLYWVTTEDGMENWFVISQSSEHACDFFVNYEGYHREEAKSKYVMSLEKIRFDNSDAHYADLNFLSKIGFNILRNEYPRIVWLNGKRYKEGNIMTYNILNYPETYHGIYVIQIENSNIYKIGVTKDIKKRIKSLQTGSPYELVIKSFYKSDQPYKTEAFIHSVLQEKKYKNEWFRLNQKDLTVIHFSILKRNEPYRSNKEELLELIERTNTLNKNYKDQIITYEEIP